jgi:hypothetical protein
VSEWKAIDTATARGLLARLRSLDWGWTVAEVPQLLRRLGWVSVADVKGAGVAVDARLGLSGREARIPFDGDDVDSLIVTVTDLSATRDPARRAFAHDVFVALVKTATELFGEPTRRIQDENPRVDWRDERNTLSVARLGNGVTVTLMPNERRDFWDEELDEPE